MRIVKPIEVSAAIAEWLHYAALSTRPTFDKDEWDKDHAAFVLGRVLPRLHLPDRVRRITAEAYLAGMEKASNGSSVVPEALRDGNIKDWQGVMHDYIFWLHQRGLPDADGHYWTLAEANRAYREAWIADGQMARGWVWWTGLSIGSWVVWNRGDK